MNESAANDTVHVLFGRNELAIRLPPEARATVIGKRPMAKLSKPQAAVMDALARPIGAPSTS